MQQPGASRTGVRRMPAGADSSENCPIGLRGFRLSTLSESLLDSLEQLSLRNNDGRVRKRQYTAIRSPRDDAPADFGKSAKETVAAEYFTQELLACRADQDGRQLWTKSRVDAHVHSDIAKQMRTARSGYTLTSYQ